jgi:hypothetical protein
LRPDSPAAKARSLTIGTEVLAVNGVNTAGMSSKDVTAGMKGMKEVEIVVVTNPNGAQVGGGETKKPKQPKDLDAGGDGAPAKPKKKKKKKKEEAFTDFRAESTSMKGHYTNPAPVGAVVEDGRKRRGSLKTRIQNESHSTLVQTYSPQLVRKSLQTDSGVLKKSGSFTDIHHAIKKEEDSKKANAAALTEIARVRAMRRAQSDAYVRGGDSLPDSRAKAHWKDAARRMQSVLAVRTPVRRSSSLHGPTDVQAGVTKAAETKTTSPDAVKRITSRQRRASQTNPEELRQLAAALAMVLCAILKSKHCAEECYSDSRYWLGCVTSLVRWQSSWSGVATPHALQIHDPTILLGFNPSSMCAIQ